MGLRGIVGDVGENLAVREWVGGGLRVIGEMIGGEEEGEEGERGEVVEEVLVGLFLVSLFYSLILALASREKLLVERWKIDIFLFLV